MQGSNLIAVGAAVSWHVVDTGLQCREFMREEWVGDRA